MTDVWVSRKRWTCKYCNVTINDDVPSRRHHESGSRHKKNVAQALDHLHKVKDEKRRKDLQTQSEIQRIESAAKRDFQRYDMGEHQNQQVPVEQSKAASVPNSSILKPWKPLDKFSAYTTADSLGISHELETQWNDRRARTSMVAEPGEWKDVTNLAENSTQVPSTATSFGQNSANRMDSIKVTSDGDKARAFNIRERTMEDTGEEKRPVSEGYEDVPVIVKRPRHHAVYDADTEAKLALTAKQTAAPSLHASSSDKDTPMEPYSTTTTNEIPSEEATLFRKRKSRGGTGKKVWGAAFT